MKTIQNLLTQVSQLTYNIETNYPELYRYLDETPVTIPSEKNPHIDNEILEDYLDSLKKILKQYIIEHKIKNKTPNQ